MQSSRLCSATAHIVLLALVVALEQVAFALGVVLALALGVIMALAGIVRLALAFALINKGNEYCIIENALPFLMSPQGMSPHDANAMQRIS